MATDLYQFATAEMRDLAYHTEQARGTRGVTKFTDSVDGRVVYVLAVPVGDKTLPKGRKRNTEQEIAENAQNAMESEGNPNV